MPAFDNESLLKDVVNAARLYASEKFFDELLTILLNEHAFTFSDVLWGIFTFTYDKQEMKEVGLTLEKCWSEVKALEEIKCLDFLTKEL
ncbi:MAG: hypothetical protein KME30_29950 [Iphinoe sp. HA4291-MV1]|jgi:hypothetical protein|nr:hypothetical protein [Iphinoe sp. HA4291-MV1]